MRRMQKANRTLLCFIPIKLILTVHSFLYSVLITIELSCPGSIAYNLSKGMIYVKPEAFESRSVAPGQLQRLVLLCFKDAIIQRQTGALFLLHRNLQTHNT